MRLDMLGRRHDHLHGHNLEPDSLESLDYLPYQAPLDAVGLDDDQRALFFQVFHMVLAIL
jgi:hypothetical protein